MEYKNFCDLVKAYFNYKLTFYCLNYDSKTIECILYDSYYFELSIGSSYEIFTAAIGIGNTTHNLIEILGKPITLNCDHKSITSNLDLIDYYCRLRLPDKFLSEFDKIKNV